MATAYLTFVLVIVYYAAGYVLNPLENYCNTIDRACIRRLAKTPLIKTLARSPDRWESTLRNAVLMYSDQQLIIGLALLPSAYAQLGRNISAYHWQTTVYLVWFSSLSHLTTLTLLRQYFSANARSRKMRLVLMSLMALLMLIALLPTGNPQWISDGNRFLGGVAASCYFKKLGKKDSYRLLSDSGQGISLAFSVVILTCSFWIRIIRLSPNASAAVRCWLRDKPSYCLEKWLKKSFHQLSLNNKGGWSNLLYVHFHLSFVILSFYYILLNAAWELFESLLWEVSH